MKMNKYNNSSDEELIEQLESIKNENELLILNNSNLKDEVLSLNQQIEILQEDNTILQQTLNKSSQLLIQKYYERPSRPFETERREKAAEQLKELINQGVNEEQVIKKMKISRATFYRFKKMIK